MLGAIKGLPAVLSGEMRDTVQLNAGEYIHLIYLSIIPKLTCILVAIYGLEKFFGKEDRAEISI